jgi:hypothetical protein
MNELMAHYGQSRNQVRRWLQVALDKGEVEKVSTIRVADDGSARHPPAYKIKEV